MLKKNTHTKKKTRVPFWGIVFYENSFSVGLLALTSMLSSSPSSLITIKVTAAHARLCPGTVPDAPPTERIMDAVVTSCLAWLLAQRLTHEDGGDQSTQRFRLS